MKNVFLSKVVLLAALINMKRLIILFITMMGIVTCYAQTVVRGVVFEDANHNSILDAGERGIAGVGVSNGTDVVLTNQNGEYELPASDNMIVFVIKPSGYRVPVNELQLSQFYYIHKPNGSPPLRYSGSSPIGLLPERVNFPLIKYDEPNDFNIIIFGDTQTYSEREIDYLKRGVVDNMTGISDMAFGATLGDLTGDRPDLFAPLTRLIAQIGVPWYHVIGNHDQNFDAENDLTSNEAYEAFYGPATYSFNYGKVHFIVADNIIHSLNDDGRAQYIGGLREDQFRFIENNLRYVPEDYLIVFMAHIPLYDEGRETFLHTDRNRLFATLSRFPHTLSLSAHTHYIKHYFFDESEGWRREEPHHHLSVATICGDWWRGVVDQYNLPGTMMRDGSPQGYFVFKFSENRYIYDFHAVRYNDPQQISLYKQDQALYANFFTGNKFSVLRYRINEGEWRPMQMVLERDPLFSSIRQRWEDETGLPGRVPSRPIFSEHLWKAEISAPPDYSVVEVEATDMYGRTFMQKMLIRRN